MTTVRGARPGLEETLRRLRAAQKGHARGAPAYSVYVNRRIGRLLAAFAFRAGLSPNQVTALSALHTFAGIALIAFSKFHFNPDGEVFVIFVLTIAAAEAALALALVVLLFRRKETLDASAWAMLKG